MHLLRLFPCINSIPDVYSGVRGVQHEPNHCSLLRIHLAQCRCRCSDPIRFPGRNLHWTQVLHDLDKTRVLHCGFSLRLYQRYSNFPCRHVQAGYGRDSKKHDFTYFYFLETDRSFTIVHKSFTSRQPNLLFVSWAIPTLLMFLSDQSDISIIVALNLATLITFFVANNPPQSPFRFMAIYPETVVMNIVACRVLE